MVNKGKISGLNINKSLKLLLYVLKEEGAGRTPVSLTLDKLTEKCSMNRLTVNKAVQELKAIELIEVGAGKGKASNSYLIKL